MKKTYVSIMALVVSLCLLCGALPVSALYEVGTEKAVNILEPVNPDATQEAKNLLSYLAQFTDSSRILSGTFDISTDDEVYNMVMDEFGEECVVYSNRYTLSTATDAMNFTNVENANRLRLEHYNNGNILLVHADQSQLETLITNRAIDLGVTNGSAADLIDHLDSANPDRNLELYSLYARYVENFITGLQSMEDAGVKAYMVRFWIEFNYRNFCGSKKERYDSFIRVYKQMVQSFLDSDLTGFLITFSPGGPTDCESRYPGNEYVDVLSATHYSKANELGEMRDDYVQYDWFVKTGKPFGFSEFSCRSPIGDIAGLYPRPSWYTTLQNIIEYWPRTGWALSWDDTNFSLADNRGASSLGTDDGKLLLDSPFMVTLDEAKEYGDYRYGVIAPVGVAQLYYTGNASDTRMALEERAYTAAALAERGIDPSNVRACRVGTDYALLMYASEDCSGTPILSVGRGYDDGYLKLASDEKATPDYANGGMKYLDPLAMSKVRSCAVVSTDAAKLNPADFKITTNLDKTPTSPHDISAIYDGDAATGWQGKPNDNNNGTITIDLGEEYVIDSYTLNNASCAKDLGTFSGVGSTHQFNASQFNTADWALQYSSDNNSWKTAHSVQGNSAGTVTQAFSDAVTARYVKLVITKPNSATGVSTLSYRNYVTISELQLFGVRKVVLDNDADAYEANCQQSLESLGAQLRDTATADTHDLRFVFDLNSMGIRYASDDPVGTGNYAVKLDADSKITVDGATYTVKQFGAVVSADPKAELVLGSAGSVRRVVAKNLYSEEDDRVRFTAVVARIPEEFADATIYARPYVVYTADGKEQVLYGTPDTAGVAELMKKTTR